MNPKKANKLIKPAAEATNCNETLVQDLVEFYWADVRKALVEMKSHNIFIQNLGTFKIKSWKLSEARKKYETMIKYYEERQITNKMTFQRFSILKDKQSKLDCINKVQKMVDDDKIKKQQIKQKRNGITKTNLGSPDADS